MGSESLSNQYLFRRANKATGKFTSKPEIRVFGNTFFIA